MQVFGPGEAMAMYHWEVDQEDFLVVSGEALLIVEGEERPLRAWDFVHCPPEDEAHDRRRGSRPCVVVAVGARIDSVDSPDWGGYTVDEVALRHEAGVEQETTVPDEAYAAVRAKHGTREPTRVPEGWLALDPLSSLPRRCEHVFVCARRRSSTPTSTRSSRRSSSGTTRGSAGSR